MYLCEREACTQWPWGIDFSHFCMLICAYLTLRPAWISRPHCSQWHGLNALTHSTAMHSYTQLLIFLQPRGACSLSRQLLCGIHCGKPAVCCFSLAIASMRVLRQGARGPLDARRVNTFRSEGLPLPGDCAHNITLPFPLAFSSRGGPNIRNCSMWSSFSHFKFPSSLLQNSPGTHQSRGVLGKWNWKCPLRLPFSHS